MIRVGRRLYSGNTFTDPSFENFTPIICLTAKTEYGSLSPYDLWDEDEDGKKCMENIWQFSKVYRHVPKSKQKENRWSDKVIWEHPEEVHWRDNELTPEYWAWREKGMRCPYPVRYPVGFASRSDCLFSMWEDKRLNYISARKAIYLPLYLKLVVAKPQFDELRQRLAAGENLLIIEVDGPHQESLPYYKERYKVADNFIENSTVLATQENLQLLLNDAKHPFGHGYCLAAALLGLELK